MKYFEHLKKLSASFETHIGTETTVAELAKILYCSDRHVKTIVQYLNDKRYIQWNTQRGRGKKPKLTVLFSLDNLYFKEAKRKVQIEEYHEAFKIIDASSEQLQNKFRKWFMSHLGLSKKVHDERTTDVLKYPFYETKLRMDPPLILSRHDGHMVQQVFDRLVEYDNITETLIPRISHHWESGDGKVWTFFLRKGVRFHHGRELTSIDVKATFERLKKESTLLQNMDSIYILDNTIIQFELNDVDYLFPRTLSNLKASIVPMELIMEDGEKFRNFPIGSGPYQMMQNNKNMIRLDVFPDYFSERPWLDRIDIIKTPTLYKDEINHSLLLSAPDDSWKEVSRIEEGASYITFNCQNNGPMKNEAFRKMVYERLNPAELTNERKGNEAVAHSFCTQRSESNPSTLLSIGEKLHYSGEILKIAAQQIRAGANHNKAALKLQKQLSTIGITATVDIVDIHFFSNRETFETYDLFVGGIALSEDRLLSILTALQSNQLSIYPCFDNVTKATVDQKVAYIRELKDESARWETYFQLEDYLKEEHLILFLNHRHHKVYEPESSVFVNVELDSSGRVDYRKVWKRYHQK